MQRDPNETALVLAILSTGAAASLPVAHMPTHEQYADGMSLYAHARSNPKSLGDPSGLSAEWFFGSPAYEASDILLSRDWDRLYESITGRRFAYLGVQGAGTWGAFWGGNVTALPKFAAGMAGVSEGMFDYAEFYAEEVMWLPVTGALAGAGQFGHYAAIGVTAKRGRQGTWLARVANRIEKHHAIPKFLGGGKWQRLARLPKHVHDEFHHLLRENLARAGFPRNMLFGGKTGSKDAWRRTFGENPAAFRLAYDAIVDASRTIDYRYSTDLVSSFWREIMKGRFWAPWK
jgi:hypothetical protein